MNTPRNTLFALAALFSSGVMAYGIVPQPSMGYTELVERLEEASMTNCVFTTDMETDGLVTSFSCDYEGNISCASYGCVSAPLSTIKAYQRFNGDYLVWRMEEIDGKEVTCRLRLNGQAQVLGIECDIQQ